MQRYLIDTNVWVDSFRGKAEAAELLKKDGVVLSYVVKAELLMGVKDKRLLKRLLNVLDKFEVEWGSELINQRALVVLEKYHLKQGLGIMDSLLAAMAIERGMILVTDNVRHFRGIAGLQVKTLAQMIK